MPGEALGGEERDLPALVPFELGAALL